MTLETREITESPSGMRDPRTGNWLPGYSGNPKGRPRKGQTYFDRLVRMLDEHADVLVAGIISRAIQGDVRAHAYLRDTVLGVPKQSMVVEHEDGPAVRLYEALQQRMGELNGSWAPEIGELTPPDPAAETAIHAAD